MAQVKQATAEGLRWVKDELGGSLERVRDLVENYLEAPANPLPLQRSLVELHQVRGTLRMVQCDGAALLAEEMRAAVQDLLGDLDNAPEKAYEALLGATLQLVDFLDLLATGEVDNALLFLPLINELRVARGAGVVSECQLFTRFAQMEAPEPPAQDLSQRSPDGGQQLARRRLAGFQSALLKVLKDQDTSASLRLLADIAAEMTVAVSEARGQQLFAALDGLIEALRDQGLKPELEIKRLLGRAGQQIKVAADSGDPALAEAPDELLYGLLYFVGRSTSDGERVRSLRRDYGLAELLPDAEELERLRARLRGPNTGLVDKLSTAIREDIETVKDSIDLVIRAGDKADVDLSETVRTTESIADTLAMLGLDMLKRVVMNQARAIAALDQEKARDEAPWMDVAMALLRVEQSLDNALFQHMHRGVEPAPEEAPRPHQDIDAGAAAIFREALINIARIKSLIPDFIDDGDAALMAEAARLLREVEAGLQVLGHDDVIELLAQVRLFMTSRAMLRAREHPSVVRILADAIVSIEYYLEALQAGRGQPQALFARVTESVNRLEMQEGESTPIVDEQEPQDDELDEAQTLVAADATPAAASEQVDPEIREVFLEEAADVLETLRRDVPAWSRNVEDNASLVEIRRAFHTLKGSGRMVGAVDIGEFAWAVENMLNRCLEGAMAVNAAVVDVVQGAVETLPELIADFEAGRQPATAAKIIEQARRVAGEPEEMADERAAASHRDSELFRIFRIDAAGRIAELAEFAAQQPPQQVTDTVVRAAHTLKGSAEAVHAGNIAVLSGALERYAEACRAAQRGLDQQAMAVVRGVAGQLEHELEELEAPAGANAEEVDALLARITELQENLPREAVEASSDHALRLVFTDEACDLVDELDQGLRDWRGTPGDSHYPRHLQAVCHTLKGSARTAEADALGEVAQALEYRIGGYAVAASPPAAHEFERMTEVIDGLYDMLDRFRRGDAGGDAEPLLALLAGTSGEDVAASSADTRVSAPEPPFDIESESRAVNELDPAWDAGSESDSDFEADSQQPQPRSGPEVADPPAQAEPELPESQPSEAPQQDAEWPQIRAEQLEPEFPGPEFPEPERPEPEWQAPAASVADAPDDAFDSELAEIFLAEAAELMEGLDRELAHWETDPADAAPRTEIMRLLHTLKGSARMAHVTAVGDVSHELESLVERARTPDERSDPALIGTLRNSIDEVHGLLDSLQSGEISQGADEDPHDLQDETLPQDAWVSTQPSPGTGSPALSHEWDDAPSTEVEPPDADWPATQPPPQAPASEPDTLESAVPEAAISPQAEAAPRATEFHPRLFWQPGDEAERERREGQQETARVAVEQLDDMLNEAGEISIFRARLVQENTALQTQLREMSQTTGRLREQLRKLDAETESQIMAGHDSGSDRYQQEFDPLEMDRYSTLNELSRGLAESVTDLSSLHASMNELAEGAESLLMQQGRINTSLQQGLMRTLMVPFSRQVSRLQRILRQVSSEYDRQARIEFSGIEAELDRNVLERMVAPLEHLLRNAVVHGIEPSEVRAEQGKPETGLISMHLYREGTQLVIEVADDGRGLDLGAIRSQAIAKDLLAADTTLDDQDIAGFIFEPGFSTAAELTQAAGRGMGMDVVNAEIKQLGGSLGVASTPGKGVRFTIRLPLTLAISQALLVQVGEDSYAVPLGSIQGVTRVARDELEQHLDASTDSFEYGGARYRMRDLGDLLGASGRSSEPDADGPRNLPVLLVRTGDRRTAFVVDHMLGSREIVVKSIGPQVSTVPGVSGATIMPDGEVVLILDAAALVQMQARYALRGETAPVEEEVADERPLIMVVDDSITIRRVSERFLARHGFRIVTAKDGMDALSKLQTHPPDVMLLDIEMPRIDGFELATYMRNSETLYDTPIVMITSRSGDKHRRRAEQIGVDRFLTKPYQEQDLLAQIHAVMRQPRHTTH